MLAQVQRLLLHQIPRFFVSSKHQAGFGLLELMLVLAIVLTVLIIGYRSYQEMVFEKDAALIQMNANYLLQGLRLYYYQNCVNATCNQPTIEQDLSELQISSSLVLQNPWAADQTQTFVFSSPNPPITVNSGIVVLTVSSVINIPVNNRIINLLGASGSTGSNEVNWIYLLQNQPQGMDSGYWPSDPALKIFTNAQNKNQPSE